MHFGMCESQQRLSDPALQYVKIKPIISVKPLLLLKTGMLLQGLDAFALVLPHEECQHLPQLHDLQHMFTLLPYLPGAQKGSKQSS